jgi:hypothetical protein
VGEQVGSHRARLTSPAKRAATRERAEAEIAELWRDERKRTFFCPPKEVLARLNQRLQDDGRKAVTFQRLARVATDEDVPDEVRLLLMKIDGSAA